MELAGALETVGTRGAFEEGRTSMAGHRIGIVRRCLVDFVCGAYLPLREDRQGQFSVCMQIIIRLRSDKGSQSRFWKIASCTMAVIAVK